MPGATDAQPSPGSSPVGRVNAHPPNLRQIQKELQDLRPLQGSATRARSAADVHAPNCLGVYVGSLTTCAFGQSVYGIYTRALNYGATNVPNSLQVIDSATNQTVVVRCSEDSGRGITCSAALHRLVIFHQPEGCGTDHIASARCATASNPYCEMGDCYYPPSTESCDAGWKYEPPETPGDTNPGSCTKKL